MIKGYLMPDLSRNLVHLRWLLKLVDFRAAGELSWGPAVLATLYKEMCGATRPNKDKIGGCLSLLQSWARFRFSFLRPRVEPFGELCQNTYLSRRYTACIKPMIGSTILMDTYEDQAIRAVISDEFLQNPNAWHVKHPRCLMMSTKSTYGNCIRIGRDTGHTISKCGKIGSMARHIYCRKMRGDDKFVPKGNDRGI
ncbi:hypothetical protein CXB51_032261 [Gossypium anomalum]|uniref:Aminotransferase-like plant mobile domain-containing protein n=1 Tax=Gossypium anomalum TaxID=47600 RepID=A0A8J6CM80_9ROSI|nr:hypothetical protein CXB51_032261 [Gossypium anomalum]